MKKVLFPGLASEMARHGDTQISLAESLGISKTTMNNKMTGKTEWSISEIEKLCEYYKKDYYELFKSE